MFSTESRLVQKLSSQSFERIRRKYGSNMRYFGAAADQYFICMRVQYASAAKRILYPKY